MRTTSDIDLLRRFEPIIRYTKGEQFFPMDVEAYVRACSLWVQRPNEPPECLVSADELTLDHLSRSYPDEFDAVHFLKIADPLGPAELAAYKINQRLTIKEEHNVFRAGQGRLARVGYISRFVDALFSLSLLARGRVPGDAAAAAAIAYKRITGPMTEQDRYCYYGRVLRQNGWIALQYWYFYPYNNWRSGFFGANDHEADWEMIYVYAFETSRGEIRPDWVAYASHDYSGDDLRRRWDDPELEKIDDHPVIYAGAGSHASYFSGGEYLTEVELPFLSPIARTATRVEKFWHNRLGQYGDEENKSNQNQTSNIFRIPFVDYARGDGLAIGPGQAKKWDPPRLLNSPPVWVTNYRGLWGLYAHDPFGGENAPAGPMYNRDGTVRRAWYDPLGWAGLDKVPPPSQALDTVLAQQAQVKARQAALETSIEQKMMRLQQLGVEANAMRRQPHLGKLHQNHRQAISDLSGEIGQLRGQVSFEQALLEALEGYAAQIRAGKRGPLRSHIRRAHQPTTPEELRLGRLAEFWAAISIGLILIGFVALGFFASDYLIWGLVSIVSLFVFIESGFRGRLTNLVSSLATGLSLVAGLILLYEFFWWIVGLTVLIMGGYILWENLRELWT